MVRAIRNGASELLVGTGTSGTGTSGAATSFALNSPQGLVVANGDLYIADYKNHRILKYTFSSKQVTVYAGSGISASQRVSSPLLSYSLRFPRGIAMTQSGDFLVMHEGLCSLLSATSASLFMGTVKPMSGSLSSSDPAKTTLYYLSPCR